MRIEHLKSMVKEVDPVKLTPDNLVMSN